MSKDTNQEQTNPQTQQTGYMNPFWLQEAQQTQVTNPIPQSTQAYSPSMQGNGMYNPYTNQSIPYADDIMMQKMPFNKVV